MIETKGELSGHIDLKAYLIINFNLNKKYSKFIN